VTFFLPKIFAGFSSIHRLIDRSLEFVCCLQAKAFLQIIADRISSGLGVDITTLCVRRGDFITIRQVVRQAGGLGRCDVGFGSFLSRQGRDTGLRKCVPTSRVLLLCVWVRVCACVFLCVWFPFHLRVLRSPYFLFCYVPVWIVLFSFYGERERERERDESDNNVDVLLLQEEVINGAMRDQRERERDRFPKRLVDLYQVWVMSKRDGYWNWESRCIATKMVSDENKRANLLSTDCMQVKGLQATFTRWERQPPSATDRIVLSKELLSGCESIEWQVWLKSRCCKSSD